MADPILATAYTFTLDMVRQSTGAFLSNASIGATDFVMRKDSAGSWVALTNTPTSSSNDWVVTIRLTANEMNVTNHLNVRGHDPSNIWADVSVHISPNAALNDLSAAEVNAEVVDALSVDTYTEPGQGAPPVSASLITKVGYLYKSWRNKKSGDGLLERLYGDDGVTVDQQATTIEASGVVTKGEVQSGA